MVGEGLRTVTANDTLPHLYEIFPQLGGKI
jgi:hypothetical protein